MTGVIFFTPLLGTSRQLPLLNALGGSAGDKSALHVIFDRGLLFISPGAKRSNFELLLMSLLLGIQPNSFSPRKCIASIANSMESFEDLHS